MIIQSKPWSGNTPAELMDGLERQLRTILVCGDKGRIEMTLAMSPAAARVLLEAVSGHMTLKARAAELEDRTRELDEDTQRRSAIAAHEAKEERAARLRSSSWWQRLLAKAVRK